LIAVTSAPLLAIHLLAAVKFFTMNTERKREMALLETVNHKVDYWDAELRMGIKGQTGLQAKQLFTMERMYKNWNDWRVKLGVWMIRRTGL